MAPRPAKASIPLYGSGRIAIAAQLTRGGAPTLPIPTNLRKPDDIQRLAQPALAQFGRVDALIHNALR